MPSYSEQIYNYILKMDPTYKNDVSLQLFKAKMQNPTYSRKIYDWIGTADNTFKTDVSFDSFNTKLGYPKKKVTTAYSGSGGTKPSSSVSSSTTIKPDGVYTFEFRKEALYKKKNNQWYVDPKRTGNYVQIKEKDRIAALEKAAKKYTQPSKSGSALYDLGKTAAAAAVEKKTEPQPKAQPKVQKANQPQKFYNFPGKEGKVYQLVTNDNGVPIWQEGIKKPASICDQTVSGTDPAMEQLVWGIHYPLKAMMPKEWLKETESVNLRTKIIFANGASVRPSVRINFSPRMITPPNTDRYGHDIDLPDNH